MVIPKLPQDADLALHLNARIRHNTMKMVVSFSNAITRCDLSGETPKGQDDKR